MKKRRITVIGKLRDDCRACGHPASGHQGVNVWPCARCDCATDDLTDLHEYRYIYEPVDGAA